MTGEITEFAGESLPTSQMMNIPTMDPSSSVDIAAGQRKVEQLCNLGGVLADETCVIYKRGCSDNRSAIVVAQRYSVNKAYIYMI